MRDPRGIQEIRLKNLVHSTTAGKDNLYFAKHGPESELSYNGLLKTEVGQQGKEVPC